MARLDSVGQTIAPPSYSEDPSWWVDKRGVRYVDNGVPYLTTYELAAELSMYPETLFRWCKKWFGVLPRGRAGAGMGYRIPLEYRMVARLWLRSEDNRLREVGRRAIITDPKDWVVVVDNIGTTHYTDREAVGRMDTLTKHPTFRGQVISTMYVGDPNKTER
jgi:AraC-like DNA-binding protein